MRITVLLSLLMVPLALSGCAPGWDRSQVYVKDLMALTQDPDAPTTVITHPADETESLCAGLDGCLEAWTSDQAEFYRFASNAEAEEFLASQPGGYQSDRVVATFDPDAIPTEVEQYIQELLDGAHART